MNDYYKLVIDQANSDFNKHIPEIFYENIQKTFKNRKKHIEEIRTIHCFYRMIRYYHPFVYVSKSKIRIKNDPVYCPMPRVDGTTENTIRLFEKQYFDIFYLLLGGMYRPIMIILRYMLEQSTWVAASVISKKILTGCAKDRNKAMSHSEFKHFLYNNMLNFQKNQSNTQSRLTTIHGIQKMPHKYIQHIGILNDKSGFEAIKHLYSELSKYAHASIWLDLEDNDDQPTHFERTKIYVARPSFTGYHKALKLIIESHRVIFYLLLITAYENVGYYNPNMAKDFFSNIKTRVDEMQSTIKFKDIVKLLKNPPSTEHGFLKDNSNYNYDEEYETCSKCGCECVCDEKCPGCDSDRYYIQDYDNQYIL